MALIVGVCAGCTGEGTMLDDSPLPRISPISTLSPFPSMTAWPSHVPKSRIRHTPTFTSLPTVLPDQAYLKFEEYLGKHGSCVFPCIWGITPGETTLETLHSQLLPLGESDAWTLMDEWFGHTRYHLSIPNSNGVITEGQNTARFISGGNTITEILIAPHNVVPGSDLSWVEFVESLGKPDEILLHLSITPYPEEIHYLVLKYNNYGTYLIISGDIPGVEEKGGRICPLPNVNNGDWNIFFITWPIGQNPNLSSLATAYIHDETIYRPFEYYRTDMTEDIFYKSYIVGRESSCFDVFLPDDG